MLVYINKVLARGRSISKCPDDEDLPIFPIYAARLPFPQAADVPSSVAHFPLLLDDQLLPNVVHVREDGGLPSEAKALAGLACAVRLGCGGE